VLVTGRILFQDDVVPFNGATAYVSVEDTTYAGARAERVGSWMRGDVAYPRDAAGIRFEITVDPEPPPQRRYTLRVLIDLDGDGSAGSGDYLNTEAVRVARQGPIDIRVKRVGS